MAAPFTTNMPQQQQQQPQALYRPAPHPVDPDHGNAFFDDARRASLDDTLVDQGTVDSGLELSPPIDGSRRESLALGGTPLFESEDWHSVDMQSLPSNNPFFESSGSNHFMNIHQRNDASYGGQHVDEWAFTNMGNLSSDFNVNSSVLGTMAGQTPMPHPGNMFATTHDTGSDGHHGPTSPPHGLVDNHGQSHPAEKISRHPSPAIRAHRDGIRKKNARFDIPPERTLNNIDQLISEATTEKDIRDLKAQKRLLRNRQAALDSRQRKKQHTERLEDEKKQFTTVISEMEEEVNELRAQLELMFREKQEYAECINRLTNERDELIVSHTNETGDLRKKIAVLSDHVHHMDSELNMDHPSHHPGNATFGAYPQMGDMALTGLWEPSGFLHGYPHPGPQPESEHEPQQQQQQQQQQMSLVPAKKNDNSLTTAGDKTPQQGGLLFMLFLVGAFVLSSRSTPQIPHVSEDVRAASETLLDNVLKDAGISNARPSDTQIMPPQPSGGWQNPTGNVAMGDMNVDPAVPSMLGELGDRLTQPTRQQTNEQIFSLSEAQYNGIHNQDFIHNNQHERFSGQGRKTLADALSSMRVTEKQDSVAEVYTRSLLWDQIPSEVVRNFAKMVAECNDAQNEQQCNEAIS